MVSYMTAAENKALNYAYIGVQFVAFVSFVWMFFFNGTVENAILFLPIVFFIVNLIFIANYLQQKVHLVKLLVFILYFVRLVLLPILYCASGETRLFEGNVFSSSDSLQKAFYLMAYEYFVVQFVIFLHDRFEFKRNKLKPKMLRQVGYNFFPTVLFCMTVFAISVYAFVPEVRESFKNILMLNEEDFTISVYQASSEEVGSLRRIIATLFSVVFVMLRILLPSFVLVWAKKKGKSGLLILLISVILQFAFITATFAQSMVAAFTLILLYGHLYPEKKKLLYSLIFVSSIGIISLYFGVRYFAVIGRYNDGTNFITYVARIVSAYFTGIENVAGCLQLKNGLEFETAMSDFIGAIPFNTTIFGGWKGTRFQTYFNLINDSNGQIPPAIGAGYYHFGWILSPIYVILMLKLSLTYWDKAQTDTNPWRYAVNAFCSVVFSLGLVMYNEAIAFSWYFGWGLLMLLALKFTNKDEFS